MAVTILELARLAGVSDATVSLVLSGKDRGRVSAARRDQILRLAHAHGYRSNPAAKALVEGRTYRIAVAVAGSVVSHAIIGEFSLYVRLGLFAEGIQSAGYAIEIVQVDTRKPLDEVRRQICEQAVDGFVFLNWPAEIMEKLLVSLKGCGIPSVASGTTLSDEEATWTDVDARASFVQAVSTLVSEGHKRMALLDTVVGESSPASYADGFAQAVTEQLKQDGEALVFRPADMSFGSVRRKTNEVLETLGDATALILTDNLYAQAVLDSLREREIQAGKDFRVIGHGDTVFADQCTPRLSHYGLRVREQVAFGLEALLEQVRDPGGYVPRHAKLPPQYVQRET